MFLLHCVALVVSTVPGILWGAPQKFMNESKGDEAIFIDKSQLKRLFSHLWAKFKKLSLLLIMG